MYLTVLYSTNGSWPLPADSLPAPLVYTPFLTSFPTPTDNTCRFSEQFWQLSQYSMRAPDVVSNSLNSFKSPMLSSQAQTRGEPPINHPHLHYRKSIPSKFQLSVKTHWKEKVLKTHKSRTTITPSRRLHPFLQRRNPCAASNAVAVHPASLIKNAQGSYNASSSLTNGGWQSNKSAMKLGIICRRGVSAKGTQEKDHWTEPTLEPR